MRYIATQPAMNGPKEVRSCTVDWPAIGWAKVARNRLGEGGRGLSNFGAQVGNCGARGDIGVAQGAPFP
jgi:hypothetical protein